MLKRLSSNDLVPNDIPCMVTTKAAVPMECNKLKRNDDSVVALKRMLIPKTLLPLWPANVGRVPGAKKPTGKFKVTPPPAGTAECGVNRSTISTCFVEEIL
jgi:hypothetical protein